MTYNNFSCRLSTPRLPASSDLPLSPKSARKKPRKTGRRLGAAVVCLVLNWSAPTVLRAETVEGLRLVPAPGTVAFTGHTGRLSLDEPWESTPEESALLAQMDAFTAQVNALSSQAWRAVTPAGPAHVSALTGTLFCLGLGVALFRAGLLFQPNLAC
jgi:hypothetical protein